MCTVHLQAANGQPDPMFTAGKVKIGRDPECDLLLSGRRVGARHAELFVSNEQGFLRDLGCGTQVNGKSVSTHGPLTANDTIQVGPHSFTAIWTSDTPNPNAPASGMPGTAAVTAGAPARSTSGAPDFAVAPAADESFVWRRVLH